MWRSFSPKGMHFVIFNDIDGTFSHPLNRVSISIICMGIKAITKSVCSFKRTWLVFALFAKFVKVNDFMYILGNIYCSWFLRALIFLLGQTEWTHHSHFTRTPHPLHSGFWPRIISLYCNRKQFQANHSQDQLQSFRFWNGGCGDRQMVPMDLGQFSKGFALPPEGHHGGIQPLRNADD